MEVLDARQLLVVDASITSELKQHIVTLSRSSTLENDVSMAFTSAEVWITTNNGDRYNFFETSGGRYVAEEAFAAADAVDYTLNILSEDGALYQSTQERLPVPVTIDRLFGEYISLLSTEDGGLDEGIQFFVDSSSPTTAEIFNVRIEYEEDYQVTVPYSSPYVYARGSGILKRDTLIQTCYNNRASTELLIGTTSGQGENKLLDLPIRLVAPSEPQLLSRYALSVRLFSITPEAYTYYQDLKQNNESGGGFFDIQKGSIFGNIFNVADAGEPVLGYFEVANVAFARSFFDASQWREDGFIPDPFFNVCEYSSVADSVFTEDVQNDLIMVGTRNIHAISMDSIHTILVPIQCSDCRQYGSLEKPEFWD